MGSLKRENLRPPPHPAPVPNSGKHIRQLWACLLGVCPPPHSGGSALPQGSRMPTIILLLLEEEKTPDANVPASSAGAVLSSCGDGLLNASFVCPAC